MPKKITQLTALSGTVADTDLFEVAEDAGGGNFDSRKVTFLQIKNSMTSGLTVGTTAIASGTVGRVLFQGSGNVLQQDAALFWDNTNKRLGVGATPSTSVRLDVRAQGALSTDVAFRVRNSANSQDFVLFQGDGKYTINDGGGTLSSAFSHLADGRLFMAKSSGNFIELNPSPTNNRLYGGNSGWEISTTSSTKVVELATPNTALKLYGGSVQLAVGLNAADGTNVFSITTGTAPSGNYGDSFKLYSADIIAGNAAPHFRTENGDIVKVYSIGGWGTPTGTLTRTTFDSGTVTLAQLAERVAALISDLKTGHQLLKA